MNEQQTNGRGKLEFPTFGCKGCEERKAIMGAANWQVDLVIALLIAAGLFLFYRVKVA